MGFGVSLLNFDLWGAMLNFLGVLGIVVFGALIVAFIADLLISIIDEKNGIFFKRRKYEKESGFENVPARPKMLQEPVPDTIIEDRKDIADAFENRFSEDFSNSKVDFEKADEEEQELLKKLELNANGMLADEEDVKVENVKVDKKPVADFSKITTNEELDRFLEFMESENQSKDEPLEEDDEDDEEDDDELYYNDYKDIIDEIARENLDKEVEGILGKGLLEWNKQKDEPLNFESDVYESEETEETKTVESEETKVEESVETKIEEVGETTVTEVEEIKKVEVPEFEPIEKVENEVNDIARETENIENVSNELLGEIEKLKAELLSEKEKAQKVSQKAKEQENDFFAQKTEFERKLKESIDASKNCENTVSHLVSAKDCEIRLEMLEERLKATKKQLRSTRKEFKPLERVKTTLDRDKQKLRRREAIVAKQKVVLYGVNNYEDIDEAKVQKLTEDIDLLDGLKMSVKNCEDIMEKNKDRYPILEQTYNILVQNKDDIEKDIKTTQHTLQELNRENDNIDN